MAIGSYFVTEEQEKIARYDIRQRGLELQKHLATLKGEIGKYKQAWNKMGDLLDTHTYTVLKVENDQIVALRRESPMLPATLKAGSVPLSAFDANALTNLISDLQETKEALEQVTTQCREFGDPLP